MRISNRLAVATVLFIVVAVSTGTLTYIATGMAMDNAYRQYKKLLTSELESRRHRVQNYLVQIGNDLNIAANSHLTQQILNKFTEAFHALGEEATDILQRLYITENPSPPGRMHLLMSAKDDSDYSKLHLEYHTWISKITDMRKNDVFIYYDTILVDPDGDVVYTAFKEDDFATNLKTGKYRDTELAEIYNKVVSNPVPGKIYGQDYAPYAPSNNIPAAFMGTAVNFEGEFKGALIVQINSDAFNEIMRYSSLLGDSGETIIVGSDRLLRSRSRFSEEETVLKTRVDTPSVEGALAGRSGIGIIDDYRGIQVISAYAPMIGKQTIWAIITKIDVDEVEKEPLKLMRWLVLASAIASILAFLLGWFLAGRNESDTQH